MARWNGSTNGPPRPAFRLSSGIRAISVIKLQPGQIPASGNLGIVPENRQTVKPSSARVGPGVAALEAAGALLGGAGSRRGGGRLLRGLLARGRRLLLGRGLH